MNRKYPAEYLSKYLPRYLPAIVLAGLCAACSTPTDHASPATRAAPVAAQAAEVVPTNAALERMFEEYFEHALLLNPVQATFIGDHRYDDRIANDIGPEERAAYLASEQQYLDAALEFDPAALTAPERISWEIFVYERRKSLAGAAFPDYWLPISQLFSAPNMMPVLGSGTSAQPFATTRDYENFLGRIADYVVWSDQAITNMREGMRHGVVHPRAVVEQMQSQLEGLLVEDPVNSLFYRPVVNFPEAVPPADRERLEAEYRSAIVDQIGPAYRRLYDFVSNDYLRQARKSVGWSELPDGRRWYAFLVEAYTTTQMTPEAIHSLGLSEVARIRAEMEQVKQKVGFTGDLPAFFRFVQDDPRFYFTDGDALLEGFRELKKNIDARLPQLFAEFPKADYEVREVESFRAEASAGGFYQGPSADGSRPGIFYINTFNLRAQPKFGMETLSLHEAAPGHHFQISIQQELQRLPRFRRFGVHYGAYTEGWALYAESLGLELGLFTDPYQYYGRLSDEMLRAMRLVVDTGLHANGWSRERAIQYMLDNSSMAESDVTAEVDRYIADPGQALGYKIGQIRIRQLRASAEAQLGARFDIKQFHSQVLRDGALPLSILEENINRWIAAQSR
ncbi:MAG: DUF885 domain-containing protein [Steroidobacteraceae bacterium]